ncbi:MAG: hypothetical protein ABW054_04365 [Casimicrobiaceae bacterium]
MKGRLNLFQVAMLRWRGLHPYNAVHVAQVGAALDPGRLREAIGAQLAAAGLTGLVIDATHARYDYRGGPAVFPLEVVDGSSDVHAALCREIERQLNLPFPADGSIAPFRFFALAEAGGFRLGLAYDHFIAGGDSIVALLQDIVERYLGRPPARPPPELYPPTFGRLLARETVAFVRGLAALPAQIASCRRGARPKYFDTRDGHNGFVHVRLTPAETATLIARAKEWGVTFNDLLLAVLLDVIAPAVRALRRSGKRDEIAVASIVNLRGALGLDTRSTFGQFLSSMRLSHAMPDGITLERLARDVHRDTQRFKTRRLHLQTLLAVRVNGIAWRFMQDASRRHFYAKTFPVWAGVTTLNVNALWETRDGAGPPDYLRAVPTGPLAPLVLAATTAGDVVHLGFSYRRSAWWPDGVDRIVDSVVTRIRALA